MVSTRRPGNSRFPGVRSSYRLHQYDPEVSRALNSIAHLFGSEGAEQQVGQKEISVELRYPNRRLCRYRTFVGLGFGKHGDSQ